MEKLTQKQIKRMNSYIEFLDEYAPIYFEGEPNQAIIDAMRNWVKTGEWLSHNKERLNGIEIKYQQFLRHKRTGKLK